MLEKSWSFTLNVLIDIDIFKILHIDINIDIFRNALFDINIFRNGLLILIFSSISIFLKVLIYLQSIWLMDLSNTPTGDQYWEVSRWGSWIIHRRWCAKCKKVFEGRQGVYSHKKKLKPISMKWFFFFKSGSFLCIKLFALLKKSCQKLLNIVKSCQKLPEVVKSCQSVPQIVKSCQKNTTSCQKL